MKKVWKWLDNFWYHHKWKTIIISFFLIVFIIGFVQCMQKVDADVSILYVGPEVVTGEEYDAMEKSLASRLDTDYNDDGKITVQFTDRVYLSDAQLKEKEEAAAAEGEALYYDKTAMKSSLDQARQWIQSGAMLIAIMDYEVYETFERVQSSLFVPLSDYLDEVPEYKYDDYSLKFKDIPYVQFSGAFSAISEDTVIVLIKPTWTSTLGKDEAAARYQAHEELMQKIVKFSVK
ncbi:MAG: hypothetical protein IKM34_02140 [Clostridia bacterium]|nr:hypothetical protein [Clostridia bacterium]